jgi:outer membrane protein TolC
LLTELIDESLRASPNIRSAQAKLRAARSRRAVATSCFFPSVDGSVTANRSQSSEQVGSVLATVASTGLASLMSVPYLFNPGINLLSFLFSAAIGVIFGYLPARRAAGLNPIDALRQE